MNEKETVRGCKMGDPLAMKVVYEQYYPLMLGICIRYLGVVEEAEDMVQEGFIKIFREIRSFKEKGSFEGWMKRVLINMVLMHLRKQKKIFTSDNIYDIPDDEQNDELTEDLSVEDQIRKLDIPTEELFEIIRGLPEGYRKVLNLHAIDGYKHREIASMLNISIGTSKSQLNRARKMIKAKILEKAAQKNKLAE